MHVLCTSNYINVVRIVGYLFDTHTYVLHTYTHDGFENLHTTITLYHTSRVRLRTLLKINWKIKETGSVIIAAQFRISLFQMINFLFLPISIVHSVNVSRYWHSNKKNERRRKKEKKKKQK